MNLSLVQELADPAERRVTKVVRVLTLATDVIHVLSSSLVRANHGVVTVDAGWNTRPHALTIVAALDHALAAGKSIGHCLTLSLVENSWIATLATCHGLVVFVLGQSIGEAVANQDGLQVNVGFLVGENLGGENWDVVTGIRFSSNVEVLLCVLGELLEEESEKSINILASSNCVAD